MTNRKAGNATPEKLVRTSVLVTEATDRALRDLAERGDRPLSREIRRALEDHVDRTASPERSLGAGA